MSARPMLPLSDVIPPRTTPLVTFTIVAVGAFAFAAQVGLDAAAARSLAATLGATPLDFSVVGAAGSLFLQPSALQCVANLLLLRIFGETLEDRMGHRRFLILYLTAGVLTALVHAAVRPASALPVAGASGAFAGVLGAYFVTYPQSKVLTLAPVPTLVTEVPAVFYLGVWWLIELFSRVPQMAGRTGEALGDPALQAIGAAFAAGALLGKLLRRPVRWNG